jgi:hypothetical protein
MPHPCDDRSLGTSFDGDSLRPSDGVASDRGGVIGHRMGEPVAEVDMGRMARNVNTAP